MKQLTLIALLIALSLTQALSAARADEEAGIQNRHYGLNADGTRRNDSFELLPRDHYQKFEKMQSDHEVRANYGLLDQNDQLAFHQVYAAQTLTLSDDIKAYQINSHLKGARSNLEREAGHSLFARSVASLAAAYLIYNGEAVRTHLSENTELSARAKGSEHKGSVEVKQQKITPLNFSSGLGYKTDLQQVSASLSREVLPNITATVDTKRSIASGNAIEKTGQLSFGTHF